MHTLAISKFLQETSWNNLSHRHLKRSNDDVCDEHLYVTYSDGAAKMEHGSPPDQPIGRAPVSLRVHWSHHKNKHTHQPQASPCHTRRWWWNQPMGTTTTNASSSSLLVGLPRPLRPRGLGLFGPHALQLAEQVRGQQPVLHQSAGQRAVLSRP